jgi:hypothetical protein
MKRRTLGALSMNTKSKTSEHEKSSATHRAPRSRVQTPKEPALPIYPALALARTRAVPASELTPTDILELQRTIGNSGVQSVLHRRTERSGASEPIARLAIQAKTLVGPAGDEYEREADGLAPQLVTADATPAGTQLIQRQPDEEEEKRKKETKRSSDSTSGFEFESSGHHIGPPAPAQQQNQLAPFNLPHVEPAHNEGALEFVTGTPAPSSVDSAKGIPDIDKLIALIKKLMLRKTQKK